MNRALWRAFRVELLRWPDPHWMWLVAALIGLFWTWPLCFG